MKSSKALTIAGVTLIFGLVSGATVFSNDSANAQASTSSTSIPNTSGQTPGDQRYQAREERIRSRLQTLVDNGTITASQADAVAEHLATTNDRPEVDGHNRRHHLLRLGIAEASKVIGIEPQALVAELRQGRTVAEVASDHGVTADAVVDALVAAFNTHVDEAVANGRIDAATAVKLKEEASSRIENFVNSVHGEPRSA